MKIIICVFLISLSVNAQIITGKTTDAETGELLPNCNISILGTSRGAISNQDGFYFIKLQPGNYKLLFQYIGYKSDTVRIFLNKSTIIKNVSLKQEILSSDNIYVFADFYSEAEQLILRASIEKHKTLKLLQNYSCKSYTKTAITGSKDSLKNKYALLLEFYSQLYWNAVNDFYEIVKSQRISANLPQAVNIFSGNAFLDINSDRISLGQIEIIGPTAPDGINYYNYEILDTLYQDGERLFKIKIQPKSANRPLMNGDLYLVDKKFVVRQIDVRLNDKCNYDFYNDIHVIQSYRPFRYSLYLPYHSLRESAFRMNLPGYPELDIKKENFREEYLINNTVNKKYEGQTKIIFENVIPFDKIPMNIPPLTKAETKGYAFIDSIVTHNAVVNLMTKAIKLLDVYSDLKKIPLGNFSDFYRFNKIEGHYLGLAINTKELIFPYRIYAGVDYGFNDSKYKYFINPEYRLSFNKSKFITGFNIYNKLAMREENIELPVWYNTFSSIFSSFDYFDYYCSKGYSIYADYNNAPFSFSAGLFRENHSQAEQYITEGIFSDKKFIPVVPINTGILTGARIEAQYSSAGYRQSDLAKDLIQNQNYSEYKIIYETGIKNWGSDFDYQKVQLLINLQQNLYYKGILDLSISAGSGSSALPLQKYFELESGFYGYKRFKTFHTLGLNSFTGKREIAFFIEHNFQNSLFYLCHLPLIEDIPLDFSLLYNWGWAGNTNWSNVVLNDFYSEWGFALGRIFSILKAEFLWRIKKVHNSNSFAFSIKLMDIEL